MEPSMELRTDERLDTHELVTAQVCGLLLWREKRNTKRDQWSLVLQSKTHGSDDLRRHRHSRKQKSAVEKLILALGAKPIYCPYL